MNSRGSRYHPLNGGEQEGQALLRPSSRPCRRCAAPTGAAQDLLAAPGGGPPGVRKDLRPCQGSLRNLDTLVEGKLAPAFERGASFQVPVFFATKEDQPLPTSTLEDYTLRTRNEAHRLRTRPHVVTPFRLAPPESTPPKCSHVASAVSCILRCNSPTYFGPFSFRFRACVIRLTVLALTAGLY